jgi:hypothetical protein
MRTRTTIVPSVFIAIGCLGALAAPRPGEAAETGGAKTTLSLTPEFTPSPWTREVGWCRRARAKLGFGLANLLLGWTDLIHEPRQAPREGGTVFTGVAVGLKDALENTLGGALHLLTWPLTEFDAPLPEGGIDLFNPHQRS